MRSLGTKLILAFLVVSLAGVGLAAFLAGRATANEFGHFMFRQGRRSKDKIAVIRSFCLLQRETVNR